jgi:hypothetical protein
MNSNGDASDVMQVPLAYWKNRNIGFTPPNQYTKDDLELISYGMTKLSPTSSCSLLDVSCPRHQW